MKRTLTTIVAVIFAAVSANAATISVTGTSPVNTAGSTATVTVTLSVPAGPGETVNTFSAYGVTIGWDPGIVRVAGSTPPTTFGKSAQSPIIAGLSGSLTPTCASSGPNKGKACATITQSNTGAPVLVPGGTVVIGTLLLEVLGGDADGSSLGLSIVAYNNNGVTTPGSDPNLTLAPSFTGAQLVAVPEPTVAALLGLGLVGLGLVGRRRA